MNKPISFALLAVGIALLIFGVNSSDAFASEVSEAVTGSPTDQTLWLIIGGVAAIVAGGIGLARARGV